MAEAVEQKSDHPLAFAVVTGAVERLGTAGSGGDATDARGITGFGIEATLSAERVRIGKPGLFTREAPLPEPVARAAAELERSGRTVMLVQRGAVFLGVLGVMDTPRDSAREVLRALHALGVKKTIMLTGDNQKVADVVARQVGIDEAHGDLLPEQKVAAIAELARGGTHVAMVGDGVNLSLIHI